jgi:hypothetical protein
MLITSMLCKTTPVLIRCMILVAVLVLTACSTAATQAQTSPTDAPVATDQPAPPESATPIDGVPPDQVQTDPTAAPSDAAAVALPAVVATAWQPSLRTKTTGCVSMGGLPDPACTPGAIDPRVTEMTTGVTICTSGYTATVRPPVSVTNRIKREQMAAYGLQGQPLSGYELDHLLSRAVAV